jgi:hypothetical protein
MLQPGDARETAMGESSSVTPAANVPAVGAGGVVVNAQTTPAPPPVSATPDHRVKKVIVAVQGVGDQYSFATLQSVVNQFCRFYGQQFLVGQLRHSGEWFRHSPL